MKLFRLLGIMLLSTGMVIFTGCTSDEDTTEDQDSGVEETDTGDNGDNDTGTGEDTGTDDSDTGENNSDTSMPDDTGVDDQTDIEEFCDSICGFIADCKEEAEEYEEGDLETCIAECNTDMVDLADEDAACAQAMMDAITCLTGLECEDAYAILEEGVEPAEDSTCHDVWAAFGNTCDSGNSIEEIESACMEACTVMVTCDLQEEAEEAGDAGTEDNLEEEIAACAEECVYMVTPMATRSTDCADAFLPLASCISGLSCDDDSETACQAEENAFDEACNPEDIFSDLCQDLCDHLIACSLETSEECMMGCTMSFFETYGISQECGDNFEDWTDCVEAATCEELAEFDGPSTDGVCGSAFETVQQTCGIEER